MAMEKRVDYIDLIKGFSIFLVVWFHTYHPTWLTALLVNSIFFFLSGIFFKRSDLKTFLKGKAYTMLIPFVFFYSVSYVFQVFVYLWDNRTLDGFDWGVLRELLSLSEQQAYLSVNVVLWFIICLFVINIMYYFISYLDKRLIAVIALICLGFKNVFLSIPTPFMINAACYYMGFFALGNLFGKLWIENLRDIRFRKLSLGVSTLLFAALFVPIVGLDVWLCELCYHIKLVMVFFMLLSVASWFNEKYYFSLIKFYGVNSLVVMGLHILMLIFFHRLDRSFGIFEGTPLRGFVQSVIVMAVMYVVILFCNRYIPFLVGKKEAHL